MEKNNETQKQKWYSIREAAEYLEVGEPTIYRWMRDQKITYRKVGDSTRFFQEDLDALVQVYRSAKETHRVEEVCPLCHQGPMVEGHVQSTGLNYFRPKKTKFWTLQDANIETRARMCSNCGLVLWFGDRVKLGALSKGTEPTPAPTVDAGTQIAPSATVSEKGS